MSFDNSSDGTDRWPDGIQCDSDETTVIPLTGEWAYEDFGCQWNYDELPDSDEQAEGVPDLIDGMLYTLAGDRNVE